MVNGGFEVDANGDKVPDGWKGVDLTKDSLKCNKDTKTVAHDGNCAFKFKGGNA